MADTKIAIGAPSVGALMHDNQDGTFSPVVVLSDDTITALAAAIVAALEPG